MLFIVMLRIAILRHKTRSLKFSLHEEANCKQMMPCYLSHSSEISMRSSDAPLLPLTQFWNHHVFLRQEGSVVSPCEGPRIIWKCPRFNTNINVLANWFLWLMNYSLDIFCKVFQLISATWFFGFICNWGLDTKFWFSSQRNISEFCCNLGKVSPRQSNKVFFSYTPFSFSNLYLGYHMFWVRDEHYFIKHYRQGLCNCSCWEVGSCPQ